CRFRIAAQGDEFVTGVSEHATKAWRHTTTREAGTPPLLAQCLPQRETAHRVTETDFSGRVDAECHATPAGQATCSPSAPCPEGPKRGAPPVPSPLPCRCPAPATSGCVPAQSAARRSS